MSVLVSGGSVMAWGRTLPSVLVSPSCFPLPLRPCQPLNIDPALAPAEDGWPLEAVNRELWGRRWGAGLLMGLCR
jgi:hypothetical protein